MAVVVVVGVQGIGLSPLELEQEGRVLYLDQVVDVLQSSFHQLHLRLDGVVAVSDRCAHNLLRAGQELTGKQLDKLVLDVLDEVELCFAVVVHDKDC